MCVLLKKPGLALARCQDVKTLVLATDIKGGEEGGLEIFIFPHLSSVFILISTHD